MSQALPDRPNLDQLRRQAKELRDAARAGDPDAIELVGRHLTQRQIDSLTLSAAQLAIAREYGFPSWPVLKAEVEARARTLPQRADDTAAARTKALVAIIGTGDVEGVRMLLAAGADPGRPLTAPAPRGHLPNRTLNPLPHAAMNDSAEVVEALLEAGADPNTPSRDGTSPLRQAVRRGKAEMAVVLRRYGAHDDATAIDRFIGACVGADRAEAARLLGDAPDLMGRLSDHDRAAIVFAATRAETAAVALMLDVGFPVDARNKNGETALHEAAYAGRADLARLLLDRGADRDAVDGVYASTPLTFAAVGSGERPRHSPDGDWVATVRTLLEAGATGQWIEGKPPSDEVAALLHAHGILSDGEQPGTADRPNESSRPEEGRRPEESERPEEGEPSDTTDEWAAWAAWDIADPLRVAFDSDDLDLFASLMHPQVRWAEQGGGGGCTDREQVLDWYRALHAQGIRARVRQMDVRPHAVILGLAVTRPGDAPWPELPNLIYQAFRLDGAAIVDIRGYPDRASALAAHPERSIH